MMEYSKNKAFINFYSGAGGVDAQDWTSMLLRMYQRYCQNKGWGFAVLNQSFGEQDGTKNASCEISGLDCYEKLKSESGVHRLVRISPFSAKKLRHTSFALVEVMPEVEAKDFKINPNELRIDTFKSSGPGGQYLQKTETAVRITHIPTGISASVQSERSQGQNKEKAMQILYSRLLQKMKESQTKELSELKSDLKPEWGSQIRSYVLNPYQMVKDHRTGVKSSQPDKVLNGDLDKFIQ